MPGVPVSELIHQAITELIVPRSRKGVSRIAIKNYIGSNSTVARINLSLKKQVEKGTLIKVKDSYKLAPAAKKAAAKAAAKPKKSTATKKKTTTKKTTKKTTKPKKSAATKKTKKATKKTTKKTTKKSSKAKKSKK
eukprot:m.24490 g.24490  ORF g.24490 m.24490 type:complete len:136 (+) comp9115_c0_seq1:297-704(+)